MRDPQRVIQSWTHSNAIEKPPFVIAAEKQEDRHHKAEDCNPCAFRMPAIAAARAEQEQKTKALQRRRELELQLADYIEEKIVPASGYDDAIRKLPKRMRSCRTHGVFGWRPETASLVTAWDEKCGLVRLCPHEARADAKRIEQRYLPEVESLIRRRMRIYSAVLTTPNVAAGNLAAEKKNQFKKFNRLLKKRRAGGPRFPIIGALVAQEDPLGAHGDWNVHLNVLLVCDGWLDFADFREAWHWDLSIRPLVGSHEEIASAFRELVKYSAAPVSSKSVEHATRSAAELETSTGDLVAQPGAGWTDTGLYRGPDGMPAPPPMLEWPAESFIEWWNAQPRFRRTRSYGCLFKTPKPERIGLEGVEWLGKIDWHQGRYQLSAALNLIPGDKSTKARGPRGPPGAQKLIPFELSVHKKWLEAFERDPAATMMHISPPDYGETALPAEPVALTSTPEEIAEFLGEIERYELGANDRKPGLAGA